MKTLFALLLSCLPLLAQNNAVVFWGSKTNTVDYQGQPLFWPYQVTAIGESSTVQAPAVLLTDAQLANCIQTNRTSYRAWESNQTAQADAPAITNRVALQNLFDNFQTYQQAWANGTNFNAAQMQVILRQHNAAFLRLQRLLQDQYKGD